MAKQTDRYTPQQVKGVLQQLGIAIGSETTTNYLCYCPFHPNRQSEAFTVSKYEGLWTCFSPGCARSGRLINLVQALTGKPYYPAMRFIGKLEPREPEPLDLSVFDKKVEPWYPELLKKFKQQLPGSPAESYMLERGFTKETLDKFDVGYDPAARLTKFKYMPMVVVPVHWYNGIPVGVVGRSLEGKIFKNSKGLPKSETLFNLHNARKKPHVIIVEASFDAMYLSQLGHNAVAILGGNVSPNHVSLLNRHFDDITLMTDFDKREKPKKKCKICRKCVGHRPGRELAYAIRSKLQHKNIMWAAWDTEQVYPHGAKDPLDMSPAEIEQCLQDAMTDFEYQESFGRLA